SRYKVNGKVSLASVSTVANLRQSDKKSEKIVAETRRALSELQEVVYAQSRYSILIVFQGMDTAGKDSLIREVFKDFNPRGVVVSSFKRPSAIELKHDYLWRHHIALPEKGKFGIFN